MPNPSMTRTWSRHDMMVSPVWCALSGPAGKPAPSYINSNCCRNGCCH